MPLCSGQASLAPRSATLYKPRRRASSEEISAARLMKPSTASVFHEPRREATAADVSASRSLMRDKGRFLRSARSMDASSRPRRRSNERARDSEAPRLLSAIAANAPTAMAAPTTSVGLLRAVSATQSNDDYHLTSF